MSRPDDATVIANFAAMIRKFDDSTFLGEILATIADSWDQTVAEAPSAARPALKAAVAALAVAVEQLETFGEDDAEWRDWESFLDFVHGAAWDVQKAMVREAAAVVGDPVWVAGLLPLHRDRADYARVQSALAEALKQAEGVAGL